MPLYNIKASTFTIVWKKRVWNQGACGTNTVYTGTCPTTSTFVNTQLTYSIYSIYIIHLTANRSKIQHTLPHLSPLQGEPRMYPVHGASCRHCLAGVHLWLRVTMTLRSATVSQTFEKF